MLKKCSMLFIVIFAALIFINSKKSFLAKKYTSGAANTAPEVNRLLSAEQEMNSLPKKRLDKKRSSDFFTIELKPHSVNAQKKTENVVQVTESIIMQWSRYRDRYIEQFELAPEQVQDLRDIRDTYQELFDEAVQEFNAGHTDFDAFSTMIQELKRGFDSDVMNLIGPNYFRGLKAARDEFNNYLHSHADQTYGYQVDSNW